MTMCETALIKNFLESARVPERNAALVAEMIYSVDYLAHIDEQGLRTLKWPNKQGEDQLLLNDKYVTRILTLRAELLSSIASELALDVRLRSVLLAREQRQFLAELLAVFVPKDIAAVVANTVRSIEELIEGYRARTLPAMPGLCYALIDQRLTPVLDIVVQHKDSVQSLKQLAQDRTGYASTLALVLYANGIMKHYHQFDNRAFLTHLDSTSTFCCWTKIRHIVQQVLQQSLSQNEIPESALQAAQRVHCLFDGNLLSEERNVVFVFAEAVYRVLTRSVPKYQREAMRSTNPFLVRPLFRRYSDAFVFAVGGKMVSSLETTWGTVGEDLFLALGTNLRAVRNGGIDVIQNRAAFDIKSGPAVMNNDQVSILHLKQRVIQEERRVPSIDTFQIGLTYGKTSQAFGTMTGDVQKGNILAARSAWEQLTGDPLAPERVYALAGLLADIVGVEDVIAAVSTGGAKPPTHTAGSVSLTDTEFWDVLTEAFDPPSQKPQWSLDRLDSISTAIARVQAILQETA